MEKTIQIQSILYNNDKESIYTTLELLDIAIKNARNEVKDFGAVHFIYGDSSSEPVFSKEEVEKIRQDHVNFFEFEYKFFNKNTGTALGHNMLGENCKSNYMMVMNPDVKVSPHYFKNMFYFFEIHEDCGLVEARQTPIEHPKEYDIETFETDWATTACVIFPTTIFNEVKGFDNVSFFMYCDDVDFSWRIRLLGKKIYYSPAAVVFHSKTLSSTGAWQPTKAEVYYSAESAILMAYKWCNDDRLKFLIALFSKSKNEEEQHAVIHFNEMKEKGLLPERLDPEHKVAKWYGNYYAKHRYYL